jgi:hypothetical protein
VASLNFDNEALDALTRAESDPNQAANALRIAAEYLRAGTPLPHALVEYLAGAIEGAMAEPPASRGPAFLRRLKLTAGHRRPKGDYYEVGKLFEERIEAGDSQNAAALHVIADPRFGNIEEQTAKRLWKKYRAAMDAHKHACKD